jgi:hypothetical protein
MHGLYLVWWVQERHVPVATVAAILAAGDLAIAALEIPTGWLADRRGYRASLIAGSILQIIGMVVAWLGQGAAGVLASCLLIAAGDAFRSGADQALLYRSCAALEREGDFQSIEGRARAIQLIALVCLILAGGAIVDLWGFAAGWLVETALCSAGLLMAFAMTEPPPQPDEHDDTAAPQVHAPAAAIVTLFKLLMPAAFVGAIAGAATFVAQTAGNRTPGEVTTLVALVTVAEALGALAGARWAAGVRVQWVLAIAGAAGAAAPFALGAPLVPSLVAACFVMGLAYPMRAAAIQREAADAVRARAASLASACDKALATAALLAAGRIQTRR